MSRDVAPEWHDDWSRSYCAGPTKSCAGPDQACREAAKSEGYVPLSLYSLCRTEDVRREPGFTAYLSLALALIVLVVFGVMVWRRKRRAPLRGAGA